MAMDPPPHLVVISAKALIKRGCEHRDLRLPARSRPLSAMIISAPLAMRSTISARSPQHSPQPVLHRLRPAHLSSAALRRRPASAQPGFSLQSCGLRTTVLPPDARVGVASPAIVRTCGYPSRLPVLARAHGAILEICYKIVNKLREQGYRVSPGTPPPPSPKLLLCYPSP